MLVNCYESRNCHVATVSRVQAVKLPRRSGNSGGAAIAANPSILSPPAPCARTAAPAMRPLAASIAASKIRWNSGPHPALPSQSCNNKVLNAPTNLNEGGFVLNGRSFSRADGKTNEIHTARLEAAFQPNHRINPFYTKDQLFRLDDLSPCLYSSVFLEPAR